MKLRAWCLLMAVAGACVCCSAADARQAKAKTEASQSPRITKVEPPNWWIGLTPDLMVLLSGDGLDANKVSCNLPEVIVERTEATQNGSYLFVWLKLEAKLRSGTLVCRAMTAQGEATFELPIANREPTAQRFHGLNSDDVIYLIMPDRFANGDPSNDE